MDVYSCTVSSYLNAPSVNVFITVQDSHMADTAQGVCNYTTPNINHAHYLLWLLN